MPDRRSSALSPRQMAKIGEFRVVVAAAGLRTLDAQTEVLGLSRSTTWHLLKGNHKGSGLSARNISRILSSPRLPPLVRATILEYIAEKIAGLYGHTNRQITRFTAQLSASVLDEARASGGAKHVWSLRKTPPVPQVTNLHRPRA
jgi:hypothetical protein